MADLWYGDLSSNHPIVTNTFPVQQTWNWALLDQYFFSLRGNNQRIDLSSLLLGIGYGRSFYPAPFDNPAFDEGGSPYGLGVVPDVTIDVPEDLDRLNESPLSVYFGSFSDTGVVGPVGATVDPDPMLVTGESVSGLGIEKGSGVSPGLPTHQNGVYYLKDYKDPEQSFMASFTFVASVLYADHDLHCYAGTTGHMMGVIHGPTLQALFFFMSATYVGPNCTAYSIKVVSPATDGAGTRTTHHSFNYVVAVPAPAVFPAHTLQVYWDTRNSTVRILCFEQDATASMETLSVQSTSFATGAVGTVLPGVTFGGWRFDSAFYEVGAMLGLDAPFQLSAIQFLSVSLANRAQTVTESGVQMAKAALSLSPCNLIEFRGDFDPPAGNTSTWEDGWQFDWWYPGSMGTEQLRDLPSSHDGEMLTVTGAGGIFRHDVIGTIAGWAELTVRVQPGTLDHPGSVNTGWGFRLQVADYYLEVFFLDDFAAKTVAVFTPANDAAPDYTLETEFTTLGVTWSPGTEVVLRVQYDIVAGLFHVYDEDGALLVSIAVANVPQVSNIPVLPNPDPYSVGDHYHIGVLKTETEITGGTSGAFVGELGIHWAKAMHEVTAYEGWTGVLPAAPTGWTPTVTGGGTAVMAAGWLQIRDVAYGPETGAPQGAVFYDVLHTLLAGPTIGGAIAGRFEILSWTDTIGTPSPANVAITAGLRLYDGVQVCGLRFVYTSEGEHFVYIPTSDEAQSLSDVIAQNSAGLARSAPVDFTEDHEYWLVCSPYRHIRLYVDAETAPSIEIAWASTGFDLPVQVGLVGAGGSVGSFDPFRAAAMNVLNARHSIGNGYDVIVGRTPSSEDEIEDWPHVVAQLYIDVEDQT